MSSLNAQIKSAIESSDLVLARTLLREALEDADAEMFYLASKVALDDAQRNEFLRQATKLDPFHVEARQGLMAISREVSSTPDSSTKIVLPESKVNVDTVVFTVPHSKATQRTTLAKGSRVEVIARDSSTNWINISFITSLSQRTFGWIPATAIDGITYKGNPASMPDLSISEMEIMTISELKELAQKLNTQSWYDIPLILIIPITIAVSIAAVSSLFGRSAPIAFGELLSIAALILIPMGLSVAAFRARQRRKSNPPTPFGIWKVVGRVNEVVKANKTDDELAREHQRDMALINIAGNMATRFVPDRKVTISKST